MLILNKRKLLAAAAVLSLSKSVRADGIGGGIGGADGIGGGVGQQGIVPPGGFTPPTIGTTLPLLFADFTANKYWYNGKSYSSFAAWLTATSGTFSRASSAYYTNQSGLLVSAGSNAIRFDYDPVMLAPKGVLLEGANTNILVWSRDLTNAAWTKTNGTAALDQTGADGSATSASSFIATAGNATALQAMTQASAPYTFSVYLKRLVGVGEVDITLDGGATWTNITASLVTGAYRRVSATQTLINPSFGIRLVVNGDKVAFDFSQAEAPLGFASSPILTTSVTATRALDNFLGATLGAGIGIPFTSYVKVNLEGVTISMQANLSDNTLSNYSSVGWTNPPFVFLTATAGAQVEDIEPGASPSASVDYKIAHRAATANYGGCVNTTLYTTNAGTNAAPPATPTFLQIGNFQQLTLTYPTFGWIKHIGLWQIAATNAQLQSLTT